MEQHRHHREPAGDILQGWVMTHARADKTGLGNDTRANRYAHRRVELIKAISLDRAVDGVKYQPGCRRVATDDYSRHTLDSSQMTLKLIETSGLHDAYCARWPKLR